MSRARIDRALLTARGGLAPDAVDAARTEGEALPLEAAVDLALRVLGDATA